MSKMCKKVIAQFMSLVIVFVCATGIMTTPVSASSVSWNFKDSGFKNLGTITSTTTVNDLRLVATSEKPMTVAANTQVVGSTTYTYALSLGGSGNTSYRSIRVPVTGDSTIKVTCKSSGSAARTLVVANNSGTQLGTITAGTTAATNTYSYTGSAGYIYLYSSNSNIDIFKIQVDGKTSSGSGSVDTSDGTVVTSYSALVSAVTAAEKAGGGKVYVKGTSIDCTGQIALKASNANVSIIGVPNSDGSYPVLDFSSFRKSYIGTSTSDGQVGIRITGSNYTIQNLIVEKAPDNGIQIKGTSAGNNRVENCIVRYNNDAGLQITGGAYSNTIRFVYSYRNCDVYTLGGNADGFAPKLGTGTGNTFYGCYAWENSDDGWDSYDKDSLSLDFSYEECGVWNNGDPTIFTGEYDFKKGNALDTNLLLVELITNKDSSFATKYNAGTFSLPTSSFVVTSAGTLSPSSWVSNYGGNPNGFKFGSVNSTSSCVRTIKNSFAMGHASKGFDNNNSACTAYMSNTVSFDNKYNYHMPPFTFKQFSNVVGFSGASADKLPSGYSATTPSSSKQATIRSTVSSTIASIEANCKKNIIPGQVFFNIYN